MQEFKQLEQRNHELEVLISKADEEKRLEDGIKLKKELYNNKLTMLDLLHEADKTSGVSARDFIQRVKNMPHVPRYATGITALDQKLKGGFESGMFVQLGGESGVGKTHLFLEIVSNIAVGKQSVLFSFEMGSRLLEKRLSRLLTKESQLDNLIIDTTTRNLNDLIMEIELYAKKGIKFFAIDSKMKIEVPNEQDEVKKTSIISNALSKLSQRRDIIVMLINQMSEESIKNKRLTFKGGGDQKYDADIALFYVKDEDGNRTLICNKNRQDEYEFNVDLKLDNYGRTVGLHDPVYVSEYTADMPIVDVA